MNVAFVNASNLKRQKHPVVCDLYEARATCMRTVKDTEITDVKKKLSDVDPRIPFAYLLTPCNTNEQNTSKYEGIVEDSAIFHHLLTYKAPTVHVEIKNAESVINFPVINDETKLILSSKNITVPDNIKKNVDQCHSIERLTRDQALSDLWKLEKQTRLTASNFGLLCKRKKEPTEKFIASVLNGKDISYVPAVKHGVKTEDVARLKYIQEKKTVQVYRCGLVINPLAPYLGASPDGHVVDSALTKDPNGVLEIKCPYSRKFKSLEGSLVCSDFYCEKSSNEIKLKENSNYFHQVQGQMLLCGVKWCDFVVYFSETDEMIIDRVLFNYDFCLRMFSKLSLMYSSYVIPFIKDENKDNNINK